MDILLSDEEICPCDGCIERVDDAYGEFYCDIICRKHTWWVTRQDGAKAQLKKVVDKAEDYVCVDCTTPNFIHLVIPLKEWQALLKEIG